MLKENKEKINEFNLIKKKEEAKLKLNDYKCLKEKNINLLNEAMSLDNTLPDIYYERLKLNNKDKKLIQKSYDILTKESMKELGLIKKINYREIYFYIINYLENVILNEPEDAMDDFEKEDLEIFSSSENSIELNESLENDDENKIIEYKVEIEDINKIKINDDENLSDSEYNNIINKKNNLDIKLLLEIGEKIKVNEIKNKFDKIYQSLFYFLNYRNNFQDFESEYYFYHCIRYMLEMFKTLKYKKFIKKIYIFDSIRDFTYKIKNGQIKDKLIKIFYYYIINTQYNLDDKIITLLLEYDENEIDLLKNDNNYIIKNNILYNKNNEILIENIDLYSIKKLILENKLNYTKIDERIINEEYYYSIKGLILKDTSLTKEEGDKIWDEFLTSQVLEDIVKYLYNQTENIFKKKEVINLFKDSSYYFLNYNDGFYALSHKELMNMYFPPRNILIDNSRIPKIRSLSKLLNKATNKIDMQHEWGHTSSTFLFFNLHINYFDTPERKVKIKKITSKNSQKEKKIKEGGYSIEYLLYGRKIYELNVKEAIYILDYNNYNKSLKDFCKDFKNLENIRLSKVLNDVLKINKNIDQIIKNFYQDYCKLNEEQKINLNNYSFKVKPRKNQHLNIENFVYEFPLKPHLSNSFFVRKCNPNFLKNNLEYCDNNN